LKLTDDISTSGQPSAEQMADVAAAGFQTVINLLPPESGRALPDEERIVQTHGMEYVYIPVIWQAPTRQNLLDFFDAMEARRERKVFVHCAANMRVSAFMALYRIQRLGWEPEKAFEFMHEIWEPEGWWAEFIKSSLSTSDGQASPDHPK
jgi:uncharacterized protein (TIGR01244 family)